MKNHLLSFLVAFIQGAIVFCLPASGASFDIKPVRLELTKENQLEKLVISNFSDTDLPIQVRAYEWHQNEKGEDIYSETGDIIVFPQITTIESGKEGYVRLGTKAFPGKTEKTYRVYIEEMPSASSEKQGANIRMYTKVGIPVFIRPLVPERKVEIQDISMQEGNLGIKVRNGGNTHFIVTGVYVQGFDEAGSVSFDREIGGWYLLSGNAKVYSTPIPQEICSGIRNFNIEVQTKDETLSRQMIANGDICVDKSETVENR